ncbi:MAG: hypothetical protein DWI22_11275 [Planctomycetota bacterium]|nr:MAG: hypothetical protein DWI22_11275 [Planctomycetota bacterium]
MESLPILVARLSRRTLMNYESGLAQWSQYFRLFRRLFALIDSAYLYFWDSAWLKSANGAAT